MDSLTGFCSGNRNLPWLWIIEYLASFKQVDTSVLHDLVEMAPQLPDDLAKNTREMVALRCLEDMFGESNEPVNDCISDTEDKVGFAFTESCEDVLQHILQEASASDLKMDGPELLKWDVHPFIKHKRAFMPKCALQQLKGMILEGNNPLAASLKESSGLMCVNGSGRTLTADVNHNAMTWRFNETGTHVQTMATNESLIPPTCENENEASGNNLHDTNLLASKRNRNDSNNLADDENMEGDFNEIQGEFDLHSNVKKLKQDANYTDKSIGQNSVPQPCCESLENLQERVVGVDGGEGSVVANQSQDAGMEESQFPDDGCSERVGRGGDLNDDQIKDNQTMVDHIPDKMCQDTSGDEAIQNMYVDEVNVNEPRTSTDATLLETQLNDYANKSKGQTESLHEEEMSSDDDEYLNERIDVAKTKSHFFSSQGFLENDFLAASSFTEQNLCMKCNKDGQLLGCNTSCCPFVVHENCLGYPAHFDEMGNFYCPFCAYSLAISEYLEAKKKASIARKKLASFFQKSLQQHPNESAEELHKKEQTHSRQNGTNEERPSVGALVEKQDQAPINCRSDDDNLTRTDADVAPVDLREAEGENAKFNISSYSIRVRKQERQYTYPAIPQLRRKKVPWTAEEEQMLKKGVKRFTTGVDDRNIPWKMILEFGSSVFLKGRTAIDLKDKWRNMCKGSPRTK